MSLLSFRSLFCFLVLILSTCPVEGRQRRNQSKAPALTGTYVQAGRKGAGGTLRIRQLSPTRIEFDLECNRGAPSYNSGVAHGRVDVLDRVASYFVTEFNGPCEIKFDFNRSSVVILQNGNDFACGFGHGVDCGGTYRLKSRRTPTFKARK